MNWCQLSPDRIHFLPPPAPRARRRAPRRLKTVTKLHFSTYISSVGFRRAVGRRARSPLEFGSVTRPSELWARQPCWPGQSRGEHLRSWSGAARWIMGEIAWPCWSTCRHPWQLPPTVPENGSQILTVFSMSLIQEHIYEPSCCSEYLRN